MGRLEGAHHFTNVMAVDRPHIGEAQLFEDGTHLGNRQAPHAALEAVEFRRKLTTHEGQVPNAFLNTP